MAIYGKQYRIIRQGSWTRPPNQHVIPKDSNVRNFLPLYFTIMLNLVVGARNEGHLAKV